MDFVNFWESRHAGVGNADRPGNSPGGRLSADPLGGNQAAAYIVARLRTTSMSPWQASST